jgi:hypothetical protein
MRAVYTVDSDVLLELNTPEDAALAAELLHGLHVRREAETPPPVPAVVNGRPELTPVMRETWEYLHVIVDAGGGDTTREVADGLRISVHAATWRLNQLIARGYAERVARGRYRALEAAG